MKFYMPVKVYDEADCVAAHAGELASFGKKALIVTGKKSCFANGAFEDLSGALESRGISFEVFSEVEENPSTDTVLWAKERYFGQGIEFVIGLGGGSPLDAAKAIALLLKHEAADLAWLYDAKMPSDALPVVCIPTTCGTGSEVTGVSVLTRHDKKTKMSLPHRIFPKLALLDGKYLAFAPHSLIVNSAVDALAHLYESVLHEKKDDYVLMTARAGLSLWAEGKDVLTGEKEPDAADYARLMRAATLAGMSIAGSGTTLPHALSYIPTYALSLAHGKSVAYFLPGFLAAAPEKEREELLHLSGFSDVEALCDFLRRVFGAINIPEEVLQRTFEAVKTNDAKMRCASFAVEEADLREIVWKRFF